MLDLTSVASTVNPCWICFSGQEGEHQSMMVIVYLGSEILIEMLY